MRAHARGFTLLETVLAAALGGLVVVGVVGVISAVGRTETVQSARAQQTAEFERAQLVMRRAFGSLAMAGGSANTNTQLGGGGAQGQNFNQNSNQNTGGRAQGQPQDQSQGQGQTRGGRRPGGGGWSGTGDQNSSTLGGRSSSLSGGGGAGGNAAGRDVFGLSTITPSVRFMLVPSVGSGSGVSGGQSMQGQGQRMELSLASLPLPERVYLGPAQGMPTLPWSRPGGDASASIPLGELDPKVPLEPLPEYDESESNESDESSSEASETVPLFRGAFELSPPRPDLSGAIDPKAGLTLWWRQLPLPAPDPLNPGAMVAQTVPDPRDDPGAVPLLTGLASASWTAYKSRALVSTLEATYSDELPAYVQFEFHTVSGLYCNWMFEVGWTTVRDPAQQALLAAAVEARGDAQGGRREPRLREDLPGSALRQDNTSQRSRGGQPQVWRDGQQGRPAQGRPTRREGGGGPQ